ncbi:MAG: ATP-dependent Clp protease ATP-binding subunit, partial [Proteobacteria bacterium]|nr:ATP-dependent Clp protease ATP-binding subunit [Pseudomonadota bacterium]
MSDNSGFNGNRFLVDAKNSRQYAIPFVHGEPRMPFQVFAQDQRDAVFKPNEVIFAFDEKSEQEVARISDNKARVSVVAFQFKTDETGKPDRQEGLLQLLVNYDAQFAENQRGDSVVRFTLTPESIAELKENGFEAGLPKTFEMRADSSAGYEMVRLVEQLPFPPQHLMGAFIAHTNADAVPGSIPTVEPPKRQQEHRMDQPPRRRPSDDFNRVTPPVKAKHYNNADSTIDSLLKQFCHDLTEDAANGTLDPVVGRDQETDQALKVLTRRKQSSLCFTGDAGVGKSAMFSAVAQRIVDDPNLPESLKDARVLVLDLQAMNAGAQFRGQFEAKLKPLIDGLQEREGILHGRKIILAIDELHSQLTAGAAQGGTDSGNMMKPFLTGKGISVMGTTTDDEYKKHIEKDPALGSRFEKMALLPPNEKDTAA